MTTATDILIEAAHAIDNRAVLRDQPSGERSMARTVAAFAALTGLQLSEVQGWQFMALLKLARSSAGRTHLDDYTAGGAAAYAALASECAAAERTTHDAVAAELSAAAAAMHTLRAQTDPLAGLPLAVQTSIREMATDKLPHSKPYAPT